MRRLVVAAVLVVSTIGLPAVRQLRAAHASDLPSVSVSDVTMFEGDQGPAPVRVSVDLSAPSAVPVKVPYSLQLAPDGSADFSDATMKSGTLTFRAGVVSKYVTVMTMGDTIVEPDQHFLVTLGTPIGGTATIAKGTGLVTIKDDDANGVDTGIEVSVGDVAIEEGDLGVRVAYLPVTLSRPASVATKVKFAMSCATKQLLSDATIHFNGTVSIPLGARTAYIQFKITPDTTVDAMNALREIINAATVNVYQDEGDVTIIDDDGSLPSSTGFGLPGFTTEPLPSTSDFNQGAVGDKDLVTVGYDGSPAAYPPGEEHGAADSASISANGRFVAFSSEATNLVPDDTNGLADIFIRDRLLGTTERIVKNDGSEIVSSDDAIGLVSEGVASGLRISADGNTVVFRTAATLDPADNNALGSWLTEYSIYAYDRPTHTLSLVSVDPSGNSLPSVTAPSVSADGRYVLFGVAPDESGTTIPSNAQALGYWVRDRLLGTSTRIFPDDNTGYWMSPAISANGRYVALETTRANCADSELDVVDLMNGNTERADVTSDGNGGVGSSGIFDPNLSADGRYVAFESQQWNLAGLTSDPGPVYDAYQYSYVRDRQLATLTAVAPLYQTPTPLAQITDSGQYAAYTSDYSGGHLVDMTTMASTSFGDANHHPDLGVSMTGDGRYIAYSVSTWITPSHSQSIQNIYVERLR